MKLPGIGPITNISLDGLPEFYGHFRLALHHRGLIDLNDEHFAQLCRACSGHTFGRKSECVTVATCWDADRLDIGRAGIRPDARYMFSSEAKRIADEGDFGVFSRNC